MAWIKKFKIKRLTKKLLQLKQARQHNQPKDEAIVVEKQGYHDLAKLYQSLVGHKKWPFAHQMVLACYRGSAMLDDKEAQFLLGKALLEEAKFRASLQKEVLFSSNSNERTMNQLFEEAHAYLNASSGMEHIQARRLLGVCYINGWGVPEDREAGFKRVVESIEIEQSWDKVPQIFASIGLNKPEFFSALTEIRKNR